MGQGTADQSLVMFRETLTLIFKGVLIRKTMTFLSLLHIYMCVCIHINIHIYVYTY